MMRLLIFAIVVGLMVLVLYWKSQPKSPSTPVEKPAPRRQKPVSGEEFWVQVYDTNSADDARTIRLKFHDLAVPCLMYEQGKKDVYGNVMKRYGISVERCHIQKAQSAIAEIAL